jgi:hypothetical protein
LRHQGQQRSGDLKGLREFHLMHRPDLSANWSGRDAESLLWLASYPRSGNTFARILLANYFLAGEEAYDINALSDFLPSDTHPALWNSFSPSATGPVSPLETWQTRLRAFEHYRKTRNPKVFPGLKTHSGNLEIFGVKGFELRPNDRILYVVRHPLDVLLSFADFTGKDLDYSITEMCSWGAYSLEGWYGAMELRGSWQEHVTSWITSPACPVLLIQYEALRSAPEKTLRTMLKFLGVPVIDERVSMAVNASRFEKLREQEKNRNFVEASRSSLSGTFFRRGESLQWLNALRPDQASRLADGCGEIMQRLGYAHPSNVYFDGRNAFVPLNLNQ